MTAALHNKNARGGFRELGGQVAYTQIYDVEKIAQRA